MTDKMREEFETSPNFRGMDFTRCEKHPEYYESPYANGAWDGWKASRASIRVDLPHLFPFYREGVTEALLAHGIKVNQWGSK